MATKSTIAQLDSRRDAKIRLDALEVGWYGLVALVTAVAEFLVLQLWRADLSIPFQLGGDATSSATGAKGMVENGWIWVNPHLGAPGSMNLLDYPGTDTLHFVILKILSVTGNGMVALNLYYLLTFPLVALTAAWAMRQLGLSRTSALTASVLLAFLPYHFYRSETHLFLSGYFMVPLLAYLAISLLGSRPPLLAGPDESSLSLSWRSPSTWGAIVICVLGASSGIYYAIFSAFFILISATYSWWKTGNRMRLLVGGVLIGVLFLSVVANLAPYAVYRRTATPNNAAVQRNSSGTEMYSLRTALMVLPVRDHRIPILARIHEGYANELKGVTPQLDNEGDSVSLGIVATVGFVYLIVLLLFGWRDDRKTALAGRRLLAGTAVLLAAALLLANSGMFGTIIGIVFGTIRAYNRIVVFVAFFSLFAVACLLDRAGEWLTRGRQSAWRFWAVGALVLVVGLLDQTTAADVPAYAANALQWDNISTFVGRIEQPLPDGAMVFQLPYVPFPENPPVVSMQDYDHFRPYLVSGKIHWSYGAVKGREAAAINAQSAALPAREMIPRLRSEGYVGIWIDRAGYTDAGAQIMGDISRVLGNTSPVFSSDGRYAYFAIRQ